MSGPFKMKGFPSHAGTSPAKRTTGDVLTKNIKDTSQKGDNAKPKPKSKKVGPVESPEAMDKKIDEYFAAKDKISASAKKGDSFRKYMGEGPASEKAGKKIVEAKSYEKR